MKKQQPHKIGVIVIALTLLGFFFYGLTIARMWGKREWRPELPFRAIFVEEEAQTVSLLTIWPGIQESMLLSIPSDLYISAVGGYGENKLISLLELGEIDGLDGELMQDSLAMTFGVPIQASVEYKGKSLPLWKLKKNLLVEGLTGERSFPEVIEELMVLQKISVASLRTADLMDSGAVHERVAADGRPQLYLEQALLSAYLDGDMLLLWKEAADVQVAVVNLTGKSQMAFLWSQFAKYAGFDIVSITDLPETSDVTQLVFSSQRLAESGPGKALQLLYPLATVKVDDTTTYRADVALLVGMDSWEWVSDRKVYLRSY